MTSAMDGTLFVWSRSARKARQIWCAEEQSGPGSTGAEVAQSAPAGARAKPNEF
jgi:hypothetical protein